MKNLFTFFMMSLLFAVTFTVVSAQTKVHVTAEVVDNIGISAEDIEKGAKNFFSKRHVEVVDESGDGVKELFVTVGKDDTDDDNDGTADTADNDNDGDKIEDNQEKVETVDLYDRLPCDMISAFPDQNKEEGVYVIISDADRNESIRFNSIVDAFTGGTDEMGDDSTFQYHIFQPAVDAGFIELPKSQTASFSVLNNYFQKVSYRQQTTGPVMKFDTYVIDYGKIASGSDPFRYFGFKNAGNEPLVIKTAKGSCGCTVPTYPMEPIMPGELSKIKVRYDTTRPGPFTKTVTLTTNETPDTWTLTIKGEVVP